MIDAKAISFASQLLTRSSSENIGHFENQNVFLENKTGADLLMLRRAVEVSPQPEDAEPDGFGFQVTKNDLLQRMGRRLTVIGDIIQSRVMGRDVDDFEGNEVLSLADKEFLRQRLADEKLVNSPIGLIEAAMYKGADLMQLNNLLNDNGVGFDREQCKATINLLQVCYADPEILNMSNGHFLWHKFDNR